MDFATLKADFIKVEEWFLKGLAEFAKVEPFVDAVVESIPGVPPIVGKILGVLPNVIASAEQALGDGTGAIKFAAVTGFFKSAIDAVDTVGVGADTLFSKIEPTLKVAINQAVAMANANAPAAAPAGGISSGDMNSAS
jgi:hypothetical protein